MKKKTLWLPVIALFSSFSYAQHDTVIVRPVPIDDVLQNPGMGITTFQRFNGQATNPALKWSEVGPETKLPQATTKPPFPAVFRAAARAAWGLLKRATFEAPQPRPLSHAAISAGSKPRSSAGRAKKYRFALLFNPENIDSQSLSLKPPAA